MFKVRITRKAPRSRSFSVATASLIIYQWYIIANEFDNISLIYCTYFVYTNFLVAMRYGVTPVLIPNTMVKTIAADGTILETVWESRWLPDLKKVIVILNHRLR